MLDKITNHPKLSGLLRQSCEENDIGVRICDELLDNGQLREDAIRILKVDAYYSRNRHNPPPAIDCLIIIKTGEGAFGLTLVELKNISPTRKADLKPRAIRPKFDTVIRDFLSENSPISSWMAMSKSLTSGCGSSPTLTAGRPCPKKTTKRNCGRLLWMHTCRPGPTASGIKSR
uniref:Uncharacterized protein n=1 Tax=Candidatus Kentrum sp. SD TaxID=2126332 RepID=A0A450YRI2_9GAMM|nr:MAG: hypothetical protein BECKSD772F_GA0070984_11702 [Candidatus Kentron sp. SD]VFK49545.1 MAG: hypothetical protein BECKSD772E_GA0070983_11894 [Candidatus Kentron sp. SD]